MPRTRLHVQPVWLGLIARPLDANMDRSQLDLNGCMRRPRLREKLYVCPPALPNTPAGEAAIWPHPALSVMPAYCGTDWLVFTFHALLALSARPWLSSTPLSSSTLAWFW